MDELKLQLLNNKKWIIFPLILFVIIIVSFYVYNQYNEENSDTDNNELILEKVEEKVYTDIEMNNGDNTETSKIEYISVDIKGHVRKPGVYRIDLSLDRRIADVITMAGGVLNDADTSVTNLSKKLFDEMVIIIYSKSEVKDFVNVKKEEEIKNNSCSDECDSCIEKDEVIEENKNNKENSDEKDTSSNTSALININTASKDTLMTLTGIGESKALAIIEYRITSPFKTIEEIMNVAGIGEKLYNEIKDYITV